MRKLRLGEKIVAYKTFLKADRILKKEGGKYVSFFGMGSGLFNGFEVIDIKKERCAAGDLLGSRIIIIVDDCVVFDAERIAGLPFEPIIYRPGNWQRVIEDEYVRKEA